MVWLIGFGCFVGGALVGALLYRLLLSDEVRIRQLEEQLHALNEEHESYKSNVHNHFSHSAQLLGQLTESYREVYTHMAEGARTLCPDHVSNQMNLGVDARSLLGQGAAREELPTAPPLDYAARTDDNQKGSLSEDYGFESKSTQH
jgi:uncharacterized protein